MAWHGQNTPIRELGAITIKYLHFKISTVL